jgi:hypothetical protein
MSIKGDIQESANPSGKHGKLLDCARGFEVTLALVVFKAPRAWQQPII